MDVMNFSTTSANVNILCLKEKGKRSVTPQCLPLSSIYLTLHKCVDSLKTLAGGVSREQVVHLDISLSRLTKNFMCITLP